MLDTTEALIAKYASAPTPPSPLSPLSSPLPQIPSPPLPVPSPPLPLPPPTVDSSTYAKAPLGYKVAKIRLRAVSPPTHHPSEIPSPPLLLPSTSHIDDIPKANLPPRKRLCLTAPTPRFEVRESSSAAAARHWLLEYFIEHIYFVRMVRVTVLNDTLKNMYNAEKWGKRKVMIMPSSKGVI
ncbi:putative reverse transcriptase domain-containing protein [Tanacetum coccineum]